MSDGSAKESSDEGTAPCKAGVATLDVAGELTGTLLSGGGTTYGGLCTPVPPIGFFQFQIGIGCALGEYSGTYVKYSLGGPASPPESGSVAVTIVSADPISLICSFTSPSLGGFDFTVQE